MYFCYVPSYPNTKILSLPLHTKMYYAQNSGDTPLADVFAVSWYQNVHVGSSYKAHFEFI